MEIEDKRECGMEGEKKTEKEEENDLGLGQQTILVAIR